MLHACEAHIEDIASLIANGIEKAGVILLVARVIQRQFVGAQDVALHTHGVQTQMPVGDIVETARIGVLHRLADKGNPAPRAGLVVHPYRIEGLTHIGAITQ